jgi:hypothetical protein
MFPRLVPFMLASLLMAAHFLRYGRIVLVVVCVLLPLLLLIKKRWILRLLQCLALVGAAVWVHTTYVLVGLRAAAGAPWTRMLLILVTVTVFTLFAGYLLGSERVKKRYP